MQFMENWQTFIHKTNTWVYDEYLILNQLLDYFPYTNMECMVLRATPPPPRLPKNTHVKCTVFSDQH